MLKTALVLLIGAGAAGAAWWQWSGTSVAPARPAYVTAPATKGDIRRVVSTSGPVRAVITVAIGSQLSGQIEEVLADHNREVKAGDLLARIDPKTFERRVAQAKADLAAAEAALSVREANLEKSRAVLQQAQKAVERQKTLSAKRLSPESNLESAIRDAGVGKADIEVARAEIESARATVLQRKAALGQAEIDLERTFIRAPIEGTVIARTVELGQTVAASLQAPELFRIAQDLRRIQIEAQVNEADIGDIREGNKASFTVEAYPERNFSGTVAQVRLAATEIQNVVTYTVIIHAANEDRRLFPGMTANVEIETGVRAGVLRVPNEALRFRPRDGGGRREGGGGPGQMAERMKRNIERAKSEIGLTDEQAAKVQAAIEKAIAELRPAGGGLSTAQDPRQLRERISQRLEDAIEEVVTEEQRPAFERWQDERNSTKRGSVYVLNGSGEPESRFVRLGLSDDQMTEVAGGELKEGETVVLRAEAGAGS